MSTSGVHMHTHICALLHTPDIQHIQACIHTISLGFSRNYIKPAGGFGEDWRPHWDGSPIREQYMPSSILAVVGLPSVSNICLHFLGLG